MFNVLVYGTLRKNFQRHSVLETSSYLGSGIIRGYKMVDLGPFPGAVETNKNQDALFCEHYRVSQSVLEKLDAIEGFQDENSFYLRKKEIATGYYIYCINPIYKISGATHVECGDWKQYLTEKVNKGEYPFSIENLPDFLHKDYFAYIFRLGMKFAKENPNILPEDFDEITFLERVSDQCFKGFLK